MRYRPRSSVTTILMNRVGRSLVSAITQTPASGPFALVTAPPRSPAPMRIAGSPLGWALNRAWEENRSTAMPTPTAQRPNVRVVLIFILLNRLRPEDGEDLVGIRDPRLEEHRFVGLALELRHRARQAEPVQELVMAAILRLGDRSVAPRRPVAVAERLVVALVRLHVREHQRVLRDQERVAPARRRDDRDAPGAGTQAPRDRRADLEAAPRLRPGRVELGVLREPCRLPPRHRRAVSADQPAAVGVDRERHDRVGEALAVDVQVHDRVHERMP